MPDRLQELLRQRTLIQEHLAWLDREVAAARLGSPSLPRLPDLPAPPELPLVASTGNVAEEDKPPPLPAQGMSTPKPSEAVLVASNQQAEEILSQFQHEPQALAADTRKGCLRAFAIGMGVVLLLTGVMYALYARHLGRWW